ncbi:uncharacterized protein PGTG_15170 [Puccinia graminis f. sp. tritici CRL 75-36-700-3]|uniref:Uncharacterized protein n=1 Tax=Puccinia graminis f. sp. tritici (strain CRL 75-36-700-3 / race SCCL) TaxID=418459 RepID=E3KX94_PUCGT|nr:uncharacterized protein PGTG_15170 [Puccinia graminis f. sp. tritici CRL 75-36-700-3]EFP88967.1 hypothetical protein PGTG_15170 [Puccinia graminis f. sp. tritici CRL 75-36-700-3]
MTAAVSNARHADYFVSACSCSRFVGLSFLGTHDESTLSNLQTGAKSCRPRDNVNGKRTTELCDTQYTDGYCGTSHGSFICNGGYYKDGPHANQPQGCQDCDDLEPPA